MRPPDICLLTEPNGQTANNEDLFTATIKF
jgi:hypothetical protein